MKTILVSNGTTAQTGDTRAKTEAGYIRAAQRVWPYAGTQRVTIRVIDDDDEIIYETKKDLLG